MDCEEDDVDLHLCLNCQATIEGLTNYVQHRKHHCPARKSNRPSEQGNVATSSVPLPNTLNINVDDILSCFSPSTNDALQSSGSPSVDLQGYGTSSAASMLVGGQAQTSMASPSQLALEDAINQVVQSVTAQSVNSTLKDHQFHVGDASNTQSNMQLNVGVDMSQSNYSESQPSPSKSQAKDDGFFSVLQLQSKDSSDQQSTKLDGLIDGLQDESDDSEGEANTNKLPRAQWQPKSRRSSKKRMTARNKSRNRAAKQTGDGHGEGPWEMFCKTCNRSFSSQGGFEKHFQTAYHLKRRDLRKAAKNATDNNGSFFSVLQLQSKGGDNSNADKSAAVETETPMRTSQRIRGSKISDILNRIQEESDSDETDEYEIDTPPTGHTGGKWTPGRPPSSSQTDQPPKGHTGGKWTPGHRPPPGHTGGKWKPGSNDPGKGDISDDDVSDGNDGDDSNDVYLPPGFTKSRPPKNASASAKKSPAFESNKDADGYDSADNRPKDMYCESCDKTLSTPLGYKRHFESLYHIGRLPGNQPSQEVTAQADEGHPDESSFQCIPCDRSFEREWSLVAHINTRSHSKNAAGHPEFAYLMRKYAEKLKLYSPFQCRFCDFYSKQYDALLGHVESEDHAEAAKDIIVPIMCVLCDFKTEGNQYLVEHFRSDAHAFAVKNMSKKKCVIKESRYEVTCKVCGLYMHSKTHMKRHALAAHSGKARSQKTTRKFYPRCPHCKAVFASAFNLTIHVRRKHTKEKPYKCVFCKTTFSDKGTLKTHCESKRHLEVVNGERDFRGRMINKRRKTAVTKVSGQLFKCDHCDFTAESYPSLRPHYIEAHARVKGKRFGRQQQCTKGDFACGQCEATFISQHKLYLHGFAHTKKGILFETELAATSSSTRLKYQSFIDTLSHKSKTPCPECQQPLSKGQMLMHLRKHTGEKPFACPHCTKSYAAANSLRRHIFVHLPKEDRACEKCNKVFFSPGAKVEHVKRFHEVLQKEYICETCGKMGKTPQELSMHVWRYHREKMTCTYQNCGRKFSTKSEYTHHVRTHTGEKPYLCDECGYAAVSKNRLNRHKRTHTGERKYGCDYCPYKAGDHNHLRRHMRIHVGSKPYQCPYCDYACNVQENIRKHILQTKKHVGLKVYVCQLCRYGSNSAKEFRVHLLADHRDRVSENDVDCVSVYSGLYAASKDPRLPAEGQHIHQAKERKPRTATKESEENFVVYYEQSEADAAAMTCYDHGYAR